MRLKQIFEFRGGTQRLTQSGKTLFTLNFEGDNGEGYQFLTTREEIAKNLQKGTKYLLAFTVNGNAFIEDVANIK